MHTHLWNINWRAEAWVLWVCNKEASKSCGNYFTCTLRPNLKCEELQRLLLLRVNDTSDLIGHFHCDAAKENSAYPQLWLPCCMSNRNKLFSMQAKTLMCRSLASSECWHSKLCCVTVITMKNFQCLILKNRITWSFHLFYTSTVCSTWQLSPLKMQRV